MTRYALPILFTCVGLLTGCATGYVAPRAGPTAKLRVISLKPNNNRITVGSDPTCVTPDAPRIATLGVNANAVRNAGAGSRVGVPLPSDELPKQTTEALIPAGKLFVLQGSAVSVGGFIPPYTFMYNYCRAALAFNPVEGGAYEAVFDQSSPSSCTFTLSQFTQEQGATWRRTPLPDTKVVYHACR
jgi:hypothetical protein